MPMLTLSGSERSLGPLLKISSLNYFLLSLEMISFQPKREILQIFSNSKTFGNYIAIFEHVQEKKQIKPQLSGEQVKAIYLSMLPLGQVIQSPGVHGV